eukprot:jgi/Botrbrau1/8537/Bobra.0359s0002.1
MLGHWCSEHVVKSYVNEIPLAACLASAGHHVSKGLYYVLKRDRIDREKYAALAEAVFPGGVEALEYWTKANQAGNLCDFSAENYLQVIQELSWVLLEDAAILIVEFPESECYKRHPVFKHELWPDFQSEVWELHHHAEAYPSQMEGLSPLAQCEVLKAELRGKDDMLKAKDDMIKELQDKFRSLGVQHEMVMAMPRLPGFGVPADPELLPPSETEGSHQAASTDGPPTSYSMEATTPHWSQSVSRDGWWKEDNEGLEGKPSPRTLFIQHGWKWIADVPDAQKPRNQQVHKLKRMVPRLWLYRDEILHNATMEVLDFQKAEEQAFEQFKAEAEEHGGWTNYRDATMIMQKTKQ